MPPQSQGWAWMPALPRPSRPFLSCSHQSHPQVREGILWARIFLGLWSGKGAFFGNLVPVFLE